MKNNLISRTIPRALLGTLALLASNFTASAEVEAVQLRLKAGGGETVYGVPIGKVLIIEHVIFSDFWDSNNIDKKLIIRHGGVNTTGPVWNTTQNYSSNWNQLLRPLRVPGGKAIAAPYHDNSSYIIFIYGRLVDEEDLFAKIDAKIDNVGTKVEGQTKTLLGTVDLAHKRPAMVKVEHSSDLDNWSMIDDIPKFSDNPFSFAISSDKPKTFARVSARALPEELEPGFPLLIILPGPGI